MLYMVWKSSLRIIERAPNIIATALALSLHLHSVRQNSRLPCLQGNEVLLAVCASYLKQGECEIFVAELLYDTISKGRRQAI